jgi:hypothetical protein
MNRLLLLPAAAAVLAAGSAHAQQRGIVPGELTRGTLSATDPRLSGDAHYDEYVFSGRGGETVVISMESGAFDTFLHLGSLRTGQWQPLSTDDDGGGGTSSRIELRLPASGTYAVRASSVSGGVGEYTLSLVGGVYVGPASAPEPEEGEPYDGGRGARGGRGAFLQPGRRVDASFSASDPVMDNREPFHVYTYSGRRGERLVIDTASRDFDAYLVLGTPGGRHGVDSTLARDDDGGGDRDARIDFTLPADGQYVIRVNPVEAGTGRYILLVQSNLRSYGDDGGFDRGYGGPIDRRLAGRWGLTMPGSGVDPRDWRSVAGGAWMGILIVTPDGRYTWRREGRPASSGRLEPFTPSGESVPLFRYFRISDGEEDFYVFFARTRTEFYMQVNRVDTNVEVARGYADARWR